MMQVVEVLSTNEEFVKWLKENKEAQENLVRICKKTRKMKESEEEMETLTTIIDNLKDDFPQLYSVK
jgi:flagellar motor switch protein FliM